jgi:hypothetical protein
MKYYPARHISSGLKFASVFKTNVVIAVIVAFLIFGSSSPANATLIGLKLDGTLEDGGSFSGIFKYSTLAPDFFSGPELDTFPLSSWDVNVTLGSGEIFLFQSDVPNRARGLIAVDPSPAQILVHLSDPIGAIDPTRPTLQVVFEFLGSLPLTGTAPSASEWGDFDPLLPGEIGVGSFLGQSEPGQPGPTEFVFVRSAKVMPEPTTFALLSLGLAGLVFMRRKTKS